MVMRPEGLRTIESEHGSVFFGQTRGSARGN